MPHESYQEMHRGMPKEMLGKSFRNCVGNAFGNISGNALGNTSTNGLSNALQVSWLVLRRMNLDITGQCLVESVKGCLGECFEKQFGKHLEHLNLFKGTIMQIWKSTDMSVFT